MSHTCSSLVLHCIDFRFGKAIEQYLEKNHLLGDVDIVSVAGAAKNFVDPKEPNDAEFTMRQIDISKRLHGIKNVILMNHTDCGAYGGDDSFHTKHLAAAKDMILQKHPDLNIKLVLAKFGPEITFEEI